MSGSDHQHDAYGVSTGMSVKYGQAYDAAHGQASFPQPQPYAQPGMPYPETQHQLEGRPVSMAVSAISGEDPYAAYEDDSGQQQSQSGHRSQQGHQSPVHAQLPPGPGQQQQQFAVSNPQDHDSDDEDDGPYPSYQHIHRDSQASFQDEIDYGYGG